MMLVDLARHAARIYAGRRRSRRKRWNASVEMFEPSWDPDRSRHGPTSGQSTAGSIMPINILMPALSPTMEKGNLAKWLKKEGDKVKSGDVIAEIETDKATMEVEAVDEGTSPRSSCRKAPQDVAVNELIALLAGEGEDEGGCGGAGAAAPPRPEAPSCRSRCRPRRSRSSRSRCPPPRNPSPPAKPSPRQPARAGQPGIVRRACSPRRWRALAKEAGIDIGRHPGLRPAWPRRRARRRRRRSRRARRRWPRAARRPRRCAARRRAAPGDVGRAGQEAVRGGQLRGRPARRHAQDHRQRCSNPSRRSRISI
jgi:pyruvate/2-oxoglutarate dehydrogenase complex dihydrolipoamide acyltransferase (E2) component